MIRDIFGIPFLVRMPVVHNYYSNLHTRSFLLHLSRMETGFRLTEYVNKNGGEFNKISTSIQTRLKILNFVWVYFLLCEKSVVFRLYSVSEEREIDVKGIDIYIKSLIYKFIQFFVNSITELLKKFPNTYIRSCGTGSTT